MIYLKRCRLALFAVLRAEWTHWQSCETKIAIIQKSSACNSQNHPLVGLVGGAPAEEVDLLPDGPEAMSATFCLMIARVSFQPSDGEGVVLSNPVGLLTYLLLQAVWLAQPVPWYSCPFAITNI